MFSQYPDFPPQSPVANWSPTFLRILFACSLSCQGCVCNDSKLKKSRLYLPPIILQNNLLDTLVTSSIRWLKQNLFAWNKKKSYMFSKLSILRFVFPLRMSRSVLNLSRPCSVRSWYCLSASVAFVSSLVTSRLARNSYDISTWQVLSNLEFSSTYLQKSLFGLIYAPLLVSLCLI